MWELICLFQRSRFTSASCSFFELLSISCGRRRTSGTFWGLKRYFAWQAQGIGRFFVRGKAWDILEVEKKRWQAWVEMRGAFERVESLVLRSCRHFWVWTCWFRVWQVQHFWCLGLIWQAQCFVDLGKEVPETYRLKRRFWLFQCSCFVGRSHNLLGTLWVSDRSRCGAVRIVAASQSSWQRDRISSAESLFRMGLQVFARVEILTKVL